MSVLGRIPTALLISCALVALAPGLVRLARAIRTEPPDVAPAVVEAHRSGPRTATRSAPLPSVLAATLRDELFPDPTPAAPAAPPPPPLAIELIAITDGQAGKVAFVYDQVSGEFVEVEVGQRVPSGAVLVAIESHAAEFASGDRRTRVELRQ